MKTLFVTDLHGSSLVFEKALGAVRDFDVDVLMVGGDLSGKRMIAIERKMDGSYSASEPHKQKDDTGRSVEVPKPQMLASSELGLYLRRLEGKGYYWHIEERDEIIRIDENIEEHLKLLSSKIYDRLCKWAELATTNLPEGVSCFWTGGNDDDPALLERLTHADLGRFVYAENQVMEIERFQIISLGFSNETPFETSRELNEHELLERINRLADQTTTTEKLILNVHVPPINCGSLDLCVSLKNPSKLVHVGSTAVRNFIENIQPLADFAGHVHEGKGTARIGRTQIFNPGSDYYAGLLHGYVVAFSGSRIADYVHFSR